MTRQRLTIVILSFFALIVLTQSAYALSYTETFNGGFNGWANAPADTRLWCYNTTPYTHTADGTGSLHVNAGDNLYQWFHKKLDLTGVDKIAMYIASSATGDNAKFNYYYKWSNGTTLDTGDYFWITTNAYPEWTVKNITSVPPACQVPNIELYIGASFTYGGVYHDFWIDDIVFNNTVNPYASAPVANFTGSPLLGRAPLNVSFTDNSLNIPTSWLWVFGDGATSTEQNPSHVYSSWGLYNVSLKASNVAGYNWSNKTYYVFAGDLLDEKVVTVRNGAGGLVSGSLVNATDLSTGAVVNWSLPLGIKGDALLITDHNYRFVVSATGYTPKTEDRKWNGSTQYPSFILYNDTAVPADNSKVFVHIKLKTEDDPYGLSNPVSYGYITITSAVGQYPVQVDINGARDIEVPKNTYYTYVASADGYETMSGSFNTGTTNYELKVVMPCLLPKITPTPRPYTPTPVPTTRTGGVMPGYPQYDDTERTSIINGGIDQWIGALPGLIDLVILVCICTLIGMISTSLTPKKRR